MPGFDGVERVTKRTALDEPMTLEIRLLSASISGICGCDPSTNLTDSHFYTHLLFFRPGFSVRVFPSGFFRPGFGVRVLASGFWRPGFAVGVLPSGFCRPGF